MLGLGRVAASTFAPAFWRMSASRRRALAAVYAFARVVDDAVDEIGVDGRDPLRARRILDEWRTVLKGGPPGPNVEASVWEGLRLAMDRYSIPRTSLEELIDGVEKDLTVSRYETWERLCEYCYGVAGTVGIACLPIFGLDSVRHRPFAEMLGRAVQLVNILRDVRPDALRQHIYLPLEDMKRFGVDEAEISGLVFSERFQRLMKFQADRAREAFAQALSHLPPEDVSAAAPALAMGRLYKKILGKIEGRGFQVFTYRPRLNFVEKLACAVGPGRLL